MAGDPIRDGAICVATGGRIAALLPQPPRDALDLGEAAIVPGFVNAHAHLEFSDLPQPIQPPRPFSSWLAAIVQHRRRRGDSLAAIGQGLEESRSHGTSLVGEIATRDDPFGELSTAVPRCVAFRELIGQGPNQAAEQLEIARRFLAAEGAREGPARRGLSPHAPYSVDPPLFEQLVRMAGQAGVPLAIHLAESRAEREFLSTGTGELVELLVAFGLWQEGIFPRGRKPMDLLRPLATLDRALVIHGNYLDEEEIDFVARQPNLAVVYCPRTHAFFGHDPHPWLRLIARGGLVAIGTDGRGSNPDLSVWNELLFLNQNFPECDPALLLRLGTLNGARALGLEAEFGTLEVGKRAHAAVIRLGDPGDGEPYRALFHPQSQVIGLLPS